MNKKLILSVLALAALCGCSHEPEPYHLDINGARAYFCVPEMHRVHLPFGFPRMDPERDAGFAFEGCNNLSSDTKKCQFPPNVSVGSVGSLARAVQWEWQDFSPDSWYHQELDDLTATNSDDVRVFDGGRMMRVVTKSNLSKVFFWASAPGTRFDKHPELRAKDYLIAVCKQPGFNYKDPKRSIDAIGCERLTASSEYSISYDFSMEQVSLRKVHDLDRTLVQAINRWRCKGPQSGS